MPRSLAVCAVIVLGGCFFKADYDGGEYRCADGRCPAGLACVADRCVAPDAIDAPGIDAPDIDARVPAFNCADPGEFTSPGGSDTGTTTAKPMTLSSMCGGFVMNGREAVYRIALVAGDQLLVAITGARKAYVIAACATPAPACLGNAFATAGNPISVTPAAGDAFVIVDDENPANAGTYMLTVTVN